MNILEFNSSDEYYRNDKSCDFIIVRFPILIKPYNKVPILRLIHSYDDAKVVGFSHYSATEGWSYKEFPRIESNQIIDFCESYINGTVDFSLIPRKFRLLSDPIATDVDPFFKNAILSRLSLCKSCEFNHESMCSICGCDINKKTEMQEESCPLSYWLSYRSSDIAKRVATGGKDCGCKK